jgi:hypothetical protein
LSSRRSQPRKTRGPKRAANGGRGRAHDGRGLRRARRAAPR